jgi:AcrR family transcriptional regulator
VPTGVAIRDPRGQLFDAAERVLLRAGPSALTSRAVTDEAGVAKGVMHRHFTDFDAFLTELTLSRVAQVNARAAALRATAGTGTVAANLTGTLPALFSPVNLGLIRLLFARDELRARLRAAAGTRIPLMSESAALVSGYLAAERDLGRVTAGADLAVLAPMLVSAVHLLYTDADDGDPGPAAIARVVDTALAGAAPDLHKHAHTGPLRHAGRKRRADQVASIATCRTGCAPRSVTSPASTSRFRSVPSLPAFG